MQYDLKDKDDFVEMEHYWSEKKLEIYLSASGKYAIIIQVLSTVISIKRKILLI
jgi:hypothetical protein